MKFVIFLIDGMADYPIDSLGGKTPLEYAKTPNIDNFAKKAVFGTFLSLPSGFPTSSDVANMSILGWDLKTAYTGRGAIEAYGAGYSMDEDVVVFRMNLIHVKDGLIEDYSAGHIDNALAGELIEKLNQKFGTDEVEFKKGVSYRNLLYLKGKKYSADIDYAKPDSSHGKEWRSLLPKANHESAGYTEELLTQLIIESNQYLSQLTQNLGLKNPANLIWPWSGGKKPVMPSFEDLYGKKGGVVSAVDVILGLGKLGKMISVKPKGATGFLDTNYENKARAGVDILKENDFVYIHVEAVDECGHLGDLNNKIKAIEDADKRLIGSFLELYQKEIAQPIRIAVLPDHPVPIALRQHTRDLVPFLITGEGIIPQKEITEYSEKTCLNGKYTHLKGRELMILLMNEKKI